MKRHRIRGDKMSNYKLIIGNKNEFREIALEDKQYLKKLENLDVLTSECNNEKELKIYLFNKGLITEKELKGNYYMHILYKYIEYKTLPIIYKDLRKYLDLDYLKGKLMMLSNNLQFLYKLAEHYSKKNHQCQNVSDIRLYLYDVINNTDCDFEEHKLLETAINCLYKNAVFKVDTRTGIHQINYRGLRDLALFVYSFQKEKKFENMENCQTFQMKLLDFLEENNFQQNIQHLSSEGDPDFPPNSEEEAKYLKYLEELENTEIYIEDYQHYR